MSADINDTEVGALVKGVNSSRAFLRTASLHPMPLHGMPMTIIDKDGYPLPAPYMCDTLNVALGERYDAIVNCTNPGTWAFHCHILPHTESEHGMFGMVTALVVSQ
jgi:FtsP/CotA-like multicopper oxidase with cupredoxin domain